MMLRQVVATVVISILGLVSAQDTTVPSVCAVGCVNGVFVNAASVGCANGDTLCVCGKTADFQDGIRDCITSACASDVPDTQIPLADAYANDLCAKASAAAAPPAPTTTPAPPPESTPTEAATSTTSTAASSTDTAVPSAESSPQSTTTSSSAVSTSAATSAATSSSASDSQSTITQAASSTTFASTSVPSSSTTSSDVSAPATTSSGTIPTNPGLSTAAKAGIGAGVGAAVLAAIIIAICVCLRRRQQNKTASPVRNYKISEPMSATGSEFANNIGRAQTTNVPRPIVTTNYGARLSATGMPTSPTSVYSNGSDLESHARRYEDMPPRTQPRHMI
ncbi:hypothetical protein F4679DRAFT_516936 [Xylaria curta]|nr:hypothetical protein F4679DRAFT_516936 [Xylaria curta]